MQTAIEFLGGSVYEEVDQDIFKSDIEPAYSVGGCAFMCFPSSQMYLVFYAVYCGMADCADCVSGGSFF